MDETVDISNISIYDMPKEDLQKEYNTLQKHFVANQKELELKNQKIYDLQREVSRLGSLEREYMQELEILQAGDNEEIKKLQAQLLVLSKELACCKESYREQIQQVESEIKVKDGEIETLQNDLKSLAALAETGTISNSEYDKLLLNNAALKEKVEVCEEMLADLKSQKLKVQNYNDELKSNIEIKTTELDNIREAYNCKKEELQECKNLIGHLQDEVMTLQTEVDVVKNKPLDTEARGNSLFAEVDNRRVQLQNNMSIMKTKYVDMKREHNSLLLKISVLEKENTLITKRWEEDTADRQNGDRMMITTLNRRVEVLENISKKYEESFKSDDLGRTPNNKTEIDQLLLELNKESICHSLSRRDLRECQLDLNSYKSKTARLECEISQLKTQINILQLNKPLSDPTPDSMECLKPTKSVNNRMCDKKVDTSKKSDKKMDSSKKSAVKENVTFQIDMQTFLNSYPEKKIEKVVVPVEPASNIIADDQNDSCNNKENYNPKKVVTFSDDTVEPVMTDRTKYKQRRGNVVSCPVIYISSKPKNAE